MDIFYVIHDHEGDKKYIGLFGSYPKAQKAINILSEIEGFKDSIEDFHILVYKVNQYYELSKILSEESFKQNIKLSNTELENKYEELIVLQHCYDLDKDENTLILGVYTNKNEAENAITYYMDNYLYFMLTKECFYQQEIKVDDIKWCEGYFSKYRIITNNQYLLPKWFVNLGVNEDEAYELCKCKYKLDKVDTHIGSEFYFIKKYIKEKRKEKLI